MRAGGRLTLGLAMLVLAVATPLACGEPFVVGSGGSDGSGGKDGGTKPDAGNGGDGGGGGEPSCTTAIDSQVYGDCHVTKKCDGDGKTVSEVSVADVYDDGNPCTADKCNADGSSSHVVTMSTTCNASPKMVCNDKGECVQCASDLDCTTPLKCDTGKCVPGTCKNSVKDVPETDIDCGGKDCKLCADLALCLLNSDCASGVCSGVPTPKCRPPNCDDKVQNGNETDVDCGGIDCVMQGSPCIEAKKCRATTDCVSGVCMSGVCQAPSCKDGVKNSMETGVDCGGACAPCP